MKNKIITALKNRYRNLGFGEKAFDGVADFMATTVTDEAAIETAIGGAEPMLKALQSDADRLRGEVATLKAQLEAAKKQETKTEETPKKEDVKTGDDDVPAWAKALIAGNKTLADKLAALEGDKLTGNRKNRLNETLKDAPETLKNMIAGNFGKMKFDSDEEFDGYLADISTQVEEFARDIKIDGLSGNGKPPRGTPPGAATKEATKEELAAVTGKLPTIL